MIINACGKMKKIHEGIKGRVESYFMWASWPSGCALTLRLTSNGSTPLHGPQAHGFPDAQKIIYRSREAS